MVDSSSQKVLFLGAGPLQVPAIQKAKEFGFEVICADYDEHAPGFRYADKISTVSTVDEDAVCMLARNEGVDFVITSTSDAPVRTAARVSEELGLPTGISYAGAVNATQKDEMRKCLSKAGVPVPAFHVCRDVDSFVAAVRSLDFDCVVKPADSAASRGVKLVSGRLDEGALDELFHAAMAFSRKGTVMVEERMRGPEVSVEAMTIDGSTQIVAITDKMVTEPPYLVEIGHSEPSQLSEDDQAAIVRVAQAAIEAIGIVEGPSHTEVMVTEDGPKVVELAARLGGDFITSKLVPLSTGVDMVGGSVAIALGVAATFSPSMNRGAAIRFITVEEEGVIESMLVENDCGDVPGLAEVEFYKQPGDAIDAPHSSNDRIGHVICTGDTAQEAAASVEEMLKRIKVILR